MNEPNCDFVKDTKRFLEGYYPLGNDCLYEFCNAYPFSTTNAAAPLDPLTKEEACFADQMWLIGRSYAASPERYSYTKISPDADTKESAGNNAKKSTDNDIKPAKPKETLLGSEGYESFFQDIARMLFRNNDHNQNTPVIYFRGKRFKLEESFLKEENINRFNIFWESVNAKAKVKSINNYKISRETFKEIGVRVKECSKQLRMFSTLQANKLLNPSNANTRYSLINLTSFSDAETNFEKDLATAKETVDCVFELANFLNSARMLRDIAIALLSFKRAVKISGAKETWQLKKEYEKAILNLPRWLHTLINGKPSLSISFCSKFLHFHNPQVFFIFDSISSRNSKGYESKILSSLPQKDLAFLLNDNEAKRVKNKRLEYERHIVSELKIAYALYILLLDQSNNENDESKELLNKIRASCNAQNEKEDTPSTPWSYSITRIVDELVTNSGVNHT